MYIGTPFVKKYPMSNSVEIYRSLFQALTKSFLTLGSLILKSLSSFLSGITVNELQQTHLFYK